MTEVWEPMSASGARVLIVSADEQWATQVADHYRIEGMEPAHCWQGAAALNALAVERPDVVILDLAVPDRYAPTVCSSLRARSSVPIVAVGPKPDEQRIVSLLSSGADAYAVKGSRSRELVARTRALLRRTPQGGRHEAAVVRAGDIELDRTRGTASIGPHELHLTDTEVAMLELLVRRAGSVVRRDELLAPSRGDKRDPASLDVHVRRLRSKLEAHDPRRRIETVRGVGFRLLSVDAGGTEADIDLTDGAAIAAHA